MNKIQRIISWCMAFGMVLSMLPVRAFSTDESREESVVAETAANTTAGNSSRIYVSDEGVEDWVCDCDGSHWGDTEYSWTADGKECTAIRTCLLDSEHTETAKATITSKVKTEPGCTSLGETTYTASFEVDWAMTQTKDIFDIPGKGHTMKETTAKVPPNCEMKGQEAIFTCANGCGHIEGGGVIPALGHSYSYQVTKDPSILAEGMLTGICTACFDSTTVELPMLNDLDYSFNIVTAPDCTENGIGCYFWSSDTCGSYSFYISLDAVGHKDNDGNGKCDTCERSLSRGDMDLDGDVDAEDLTLLARHVGRIEMSSDPVVLENADVDRDGDVDAADLTLHARYVGRIITDWPEA